MNGFIAEFVITFYVGGVEADTWTDVPIVPRVGERVRLRRRTGTVTAVEYSKPIGHWMDIRVTVEEDVAVQITRDWVAAGEKLMKSDRQIDADVRKEGY